MNTALHSYKTIDLSLSQEDSWQQELYEVNAPKLLGVAIRYCKNRMEAEDLLHDCFIIIFESIHKFKGDGPIEGWMRRIVVNQAIKRVTRKKKSVEFNEEILNDDLIEDAPADTRYTKEQLMAALSSLPQGYKLVFNLYAIDEYSHKEIGEQLNISEGTSRSQFHRARKLLQQKLKKYG